MIYFLTIVVLVFLQQLSVQYAATYNYFSSELNLEPFVRNHECMPNRKVAFSSVRFHQIAITVHKIYGIPLECQRVLPLS